MRTPLPPEGLHRLGRALADPTRCQLLLRLADGPAYPSELGAELGLTKANVSNHLACLRGCGLVVATPEGRRQRYEIADPRLAGSIGDLAHLTFEVTSAVCEIEEGIAS